MTSRAHRYIVDYILEKYPSWSLHLDHMEDTEYQTPRCTRRPGTDHRDTWNNSGILCLCWEHLEKEIDNQLIFLDKYIVIIINIDSPKQMQSHAVFWCVFCFAKYTECFFEVWESVSFHHLLSVQSVLKIIIASFFILYAFFL